MRPPYRLNADSVHIVRFCRPFRIMADMAYVLWFDRAMLNETIYSELVARAGADHSWPGCATKDSRIVAALTAIMRYFQGNVCAFCGEAEDGDTLVMCHIIGAAGPDGVRRGYIPSNLALGHSASCNAADNKRGIVDVPLSAIVRPDLVMTTWPRGLSRIGNDIRRANLARAAEATARRDAIRGF